MIDGESGYFAKNNATDVARKVVELLRSPTKREKFGTRSRELARVYTERRQTRQLLKLYEQIIVAHTPREKRKLFRFRDDD